MAVMPGMTGEVAHVVGPADTAAALGSGTVEVLGTPRVLAWCEQASVAALAPGLRDTDVSVGTRVQLEHVQPALVGDRVTARAEVIAVEGRLVTCEVEAVRHDPDGTTLLAHGEVVRAILDRERFLGRAREARPAG